MNLIDDRAKEISRANSMLEVASWASYRYATYNHSAVTRIVEAATKRGEALARELAEAAVEETGFGVVEHKVIKNLGCSRELLDRYTGFDFATPVVDPHTKTVSIPKPAGVVLGITPSTNPVATVYAKALMALMARCSIIISPHPFAKKVCARAAHELNAAAVEAGAPDGVIQVVEEPSIPLIEHLMKSDKVDLIVATGGSEVVRSAYSSSNPAYGVGPGNVPVVVDASANLKDAARRIVDSKSFDNSILCTNESVLIVERRVAEKLKAELARAGAHLCSETESEALRDLLFPRGQFDTRFVGKDARSIAKAASIRVPPSVRILAAEFGAVFPEEPLCHEKLCPVLGLVVADDFDDAIAKAKAVLRVTGAGHSAALHSSDGDNIATFGAALPVLRVSLNVGNSLGSSGFETNLPPTMTIGTGFLGRSSLGENLRPDHLVHYTTIALNRDPAEVLPDRSHLDRNDMPNGAVPAYPLEGVTRPSGMDMRSSVAVPRPGASDPGEVALRAQIRQLVLEELAEMMKG